MQTPSVPCRPWPSSTARTPSLGASWAAPCAKPATARRPSRPGGGCRTATSATWKPTRPCRKCCRKAAARPSSRCACWPRRLAPVIPGPGASWPRCWSRTTKPTRLWRPGARCLNVLPAISPAMSGWRLCWKTSAAGTRRPRTRRRWPRPIPPGSSPGSATPAPWKLSTVGRRRSRSGGASSSSTRPTSRRTAGWRSCCWVRASTPGPWSTCAPSPRLPRTRGRGGGWRGC